MGTKTISITETAYQRLLQEKRGAESFTEVILRLTGKRSLRSLAGLLSKAEADALAQAITEGRAQRQSRRRTRLKGAA